MKLIVLPQAADEFEDAVAHYDGKQTGLGQRFRDGCRVALAARRPDGAEVAASTTATRELPNQPAAPNAGIASQLTSEHHWPGVGEPER